MKMPAWLNVLFGIIYVASAPTLTILVDHHDLSQPASVQIAGAIAVFAAGFHGSQFVTAVKASPVGKIVATIEQDAPTVLAALTPLSADAPAVSTLTATQPVTADPTAVKPGA